MLILNAVGPFKQLSHTIYSTGKYQSIHIVKHWYSNTNPPIKTPAARIIMPHNRFYYIHEFSPVMSYLEYLKSMESK